MAQKYKVFINDIPLTLAHPADGTVVHRNDKHHITTRYVGNYKIFRQYMDTLEKSTRFHSVTILNEDVGELWRVFCQQFKLVEAAGGLIKNPADELLFIYRRGSWDMAKGKIDDGETPEIAAVREVLEETGISANIIEPAAITYHTYRDRKDRRILKPTHWYHMRCTETTLTLQHEEDIEDAVWMKIADFLASDKHIYAGLRDLLENVG